MGAIVASGTLARLSGAQNPDSEKLSPYECGFEAFEDARMKFDVRYYLVAILFILFDLEIAFLFPWAVVLQEIGWFGLVAMLIFLGILVGINWLANRQNKRWDLTENQQFTLAEQTQQVVRDLKQPLHVRVFYDSRDGQGAQAYRDKLAKEKKPGR